MFKMFYYCNGLETLNISSFDTSSLTNAEDMFTVYYTAAKIRKLVLGSDLDLKGKDTTNGKSWIYLTVPPSSNGYTGKWVLEDDPTGNSAMTTTEMRNARKVTPGTWVWQVASGKGVVTFSANGGHTTAQDVVANSPAYSFKMPNADTTKRPHYALTGWNTKVNGTGASYAPDQTVNNVLVLGKTTYLYAQWAPSNLREYSVRHYQQKTTLDGYTLTETQVLYGNYGTEVSPEVKSYPGFISPAVQTKTVLEDDSMVIEYYYDRNTYTVRFDGNGATSGMMDDQMMRGGISSALIPNIFTKTGSIFTGWNTEADGSGTGFIDKQNVTDLTFENGGAVTLYAQWLDNPNGALGPQNGVIYVRCKAGQTIIIPELPDGTSYTMEETDIPSGWM
jgi:uncharacterized repeat protein (TIGR02543 family)